MSRPWQGSARPVVVAGALGCGLITLLGFNDGGYFDTSWRWAAPGFAAVVALAIALRRDLSISRAGSASLLALAGLSVWMLLSAFWGLPGTEATHEAARGGLYVAGLGALLVVVRGQTSAALLRGVLAGVITLELYALGQRLLQTPDPDPFEGSLLAEPVGYANAFGMLAALGVVLAIGLLLEGHGSIGTVLVGAAAGVSGLALVLTSSRGAWVAAAVGLVVLMALHPGRGQFLRQGRWQVLGAVLAVAIGLWAVLSPPSAALGDRPAYWRVAVEDAVRHPLLGSGAGSFDDVWLARRPITVNVRDAHSLYLESLAELGPLGLALLLGVLAPPLIAVRTARAGDRKIVAVAAAGYSVFLLHAGVDWDWEMPVTTLAGLACAAALLGIARSRV